MDYTNVGVDVYTILLGLSAGNNLAVQLPINNASGTNSGLPYNTDGHYLVAVGIKSDTSGSDPYVCVSDPYNVNSKSYAGVWEIPIAELYNFSQRHSAYLIAEVPN